MLYVHQVTKQCARPLQCSEYDWKSEPKFSEIMMSSFNIKMQSQISEHRFFSLPRHITRWIRGRCQQRSQRIVHCHRCGSNSERTSTASSSCSQNCWCLDGNTTVFSVNEVVVQTIRTEISRHPCLAAFHFEHTEKDSMVIVLRMKRLKIIKQKILYIHFLSRS